MIRIEQGIVSGRICDGKELVSSRFSTKRTKNVINRENHCCWY